MKTIAVSDLRANLMKVIEQVRQGARVQITNRGKVVAQLLPAEAARDEAKRKLMELASRSEIVDVVSPIDERWDADSR